MTSKKTYIKNNIKFDINQKGFMDFDMIPFLMLFLSLIAFSLDTFMFTPRLNALSEASSYAIKTVERQGGIDSTPFAHIDSSEFTTSAILIDNINVMLSNAGFDISKTQVIINNQPLSSSSKIGPYDYGEEIELTVVGVFPYQFSNTINPDFNQKVRSDKLGVSTYLIRSE